MVISGLTLKEYEDNRANKIFYLLLIMEVKLKF